MKHYIAALDQLAVNLEVARRPDLAAEVDAAAMLLATADEDIPQATSELADVLREHLPGLSIEHALVVAKDLVATYGESQGTESDALFPSGALPHKERREGPHPKDVTPGKAEWWG